MGNRYDYDSQHSPADDYYASQVCPHGDRLGWCDRGGCDEYPYE